MKAERAVAILAEMATTPRTERYGRELAEILDVHNGTIQQILLELTANGVLEERWESAKERGARGGSPFRRFFKLAPEWRSNPGRWL